MSLDIHIKVEGRTFHFQINEDFHSSVFTSSMNWRGFRLLRKIKDYYRADCYFSGDDARSFLAELEEACMICSLKNNELSIMMKAIHLKQVESLRVSSD